MCVLQTQGPCCVGCDARQRFRHREAEERAGHVCHQQQAQRWRSARVVVGGHGHGHARGAQGCDRWQVCVAQCVVSPGQQHGHRACRAHGVYARLGQVFDVVARQGAVARGQRRTAHVGQLLSMQLHGQTQRLGRLEDLLGFGQRKRDVFTEHIDRVHQALRVQRRQHLFTDQVDVVLAAPGVFGWQGMGAQKRGAHSHTVVATQAAGHAQLLGLVRQAQAIARLDFDGANPVGQQLLQAGRGHGIELFFAGIACGLDR